MTRLASMLAVILCPLLLIGDEPQPPAPDNDPLLRALKELQREVDQLRDEVRGKSPVRKLPPRKTPGGSMPSQHPVCVD